MRPAKILTTPILSYARMRAHSSGLRNSLAGCPRGNPSRSHVTQETSRSSTIAKWNHQFRI